MKAGKSVPQAAPIDQAHQRLAYHVAHVERSPTAPKGFRGHLVRLNDLLELSIAVVVVILLFISAGLVLWISSADLYGALVIERSLDIPYIIQLLSSIMLALVLAEIISTVSAFLREGIFSPVPFLVVAIIASVRRILLISIENKELVGDGSEISTGLMIELGLLALVIGICAWAIGVLRRSNIELLSASRARAEDEAG